MLIVVLLFAAQHHVRADVSLALHSLDEQDLQPGEQMVKVTEFPDKRAFRSRSGNHVDAGYRYKVFDAGGFPLWAYDEQWCGYVNSTRYVDLNRVDLEELAKRADITLPDAPDLSFWYVGLTKSIVSIAAAFLMLRWIKRRIWPRRSAGNVDSVPRQREVLLAEAQAYMHDTRLMIVACMAKFAKIDGVVTKNELASVERIFETMDLTGDQRPVAIHTFRLAKTGMATFQSCVRLYQEMHQNDPQCLEILVGVLFAIAHADGVPTVRTNEVLADACRWLGFNYQACADAYERKRHAAKPTGVEAAYVTLGCQPNDPPNVIRDRYRKLVKDFHPDTIMAKNLPAEFVKFAEERFKQIQAAYDTIMESRTAGKT